MIGLLFHARFKSAFFRGTAIFKLRQVEGAVKNVGAPLP